MNKLRNKLLLSIWMLVATTVTLASTTYAWFASNKEVGLDDFDLELETQQNMLVSIDGVNFSSRITNEELKRGIVAKYKGIDVNDVDDVSSFDDIHLQCVTYDGTSFKKITDKVDSNKNYILEETSVVSGMFISFDLWFQYTSFKNDNSSYYVTFVGDSYSEENKVPKSHLGNVKDENDEDENHKDDSEDIILHNKLTAYDKSKEQAKFYNAGDVFTINTANALRLGVTTNESENLIFEPNIGYSSYAILGETDPLYDPAYNPMLTYFNNINLGNLAPISENVDIYKNTIKSFDSNTKLGVFTKNDDNLYNTIKLTISVWLEGMDGDYIIGCTDTSLSMLLNFCVKKYEEVE